jgi:hypothetical protein
MKLGKEVEGRLKGLPTLFCDYQEKNKAITWLKDNPSKITHVYVSIPKETDYSALDIGGWFSSYLVTIDTWYPKIVRPANVTYMYRMPGDHKEASAIFLGVLKSEDQIKVENDKYVWVFPFNSAIITLPADFNGDLEL